MATEFDIPKPSRFRFWLDVTISGIIRYSTGESHTSDSFRLLALTGEWHRNLTLHLICLDVRKGTKGEAPWLHSVHEYLACMDLNNEADYRLLNEPEPSKTQVREKGAGWQAFKAKASASAKERARADKVKKLKRSEIRVNKVLGLFVANARFG